LPFSNFSNSEFVYNAPGSQNYYQRYRQLCFRVKFAYQTLDFTFLSRNLYRSYPKDSKSQNSEYEVHQVGPEDKGSQNFRFLAFIGTELVSRKISATATARDRRKKNYHYFAHIHMWLASKKHYYTKFFFFLSLRVSMGEFAHRPNPLTRLVLQLHNFYRNRSGTTTI
jgi:hypothetical protein